MRSKHEYKEVKEKKVGTKYKSSNWDATNKRYHTCQEIFMLVPRWEPRSWSAAEQ